MALGRAAPAHGGRGKMLAVGLAVFWLFTLTSLAEAGLDTGVAVDAARDAGAAGARQGDAAAGNSGDKWWWDWWRQQREAQQRREREERERQQRREREERERQQREAQVVANLPFTSLNTPCGTATRQDRVGYFGGDITCAEKVGGCDKSKGDDPFNQGLASRRVTGSDQEQYKQCAELCCSHHMCYFFSIYMSVCYIKKVRLPAVCFRKAIGLTPPCL